MTQTQEKDKSVLSMDQPLVSVVIPMYNEKEHILRCLDSIFTQNYPRDKIEVCLVDGQSTDGSRELVAEYTDNHPNVQLLSNPDRITPKGLNIGIKAAKGEVIIIVGAHTQLDANFIYNNIKHIRENSVLCVGGTQINKGDTFIQQAIGNVMGSRFGIMSAPYRYRNKAGYVDTVVYAAYHRCLFERIGYFDEKKLISEDAEFNWRIRKTGYKIYFSPDIISFYLPRENFFRLAKQFFRYGILRVNVVKKHLDALKLLHLIPAAFVLLLTITTILSFFSGTIHPIFILLCVLYGVYLLIATLLTAADSGWKYLPVLPVAFITMQLCFGAGFLVGLFKSH